LAAFWDCFSYDVTCTVFDRLQESRVRVQMKDGSWEGGQYMFTLDWYGRETRKKAGDGGHKCAHMIALDNGVFAAQPTTAFSGLPCVRDTVFGEADY